MRNRLQQILENCPKLWRTRRVAKDENAVAFLDAEYPGVPLTLQIHSFLTGASPYCVVCNTPVKTQGKTTCSTQCRDYRAKQNTLARVTKQKDTIKKKYGVDSVAQIPGVMEKRQATMRQKYGALTSPKTRQMAKSRSQSLQTKGRKTLLEKYGVINPGQLSDHHQKCQQTSLQHYGVTHYRLSQEFKEKKQQQRLSRWDHFSPPDIKIHNISDANIIKQEKYQNPNAVIDFSCLQCGGSESIPSETFKWRVQNTGTSCRHCANISHGSAAENEIRQYVRSLGFDTVDNSRLLDGKEIDIFIPDAGIGIEYHGLFWHNDLRIEKSYHLGKLESALNNDIRLIQVFEDEWMHHPDIVKSRLSHILHRQSRRLWARRCEVKPISSNIATTFLEHNHIQGAAKSSVKLGLFHDDELLSVMTFSNLTRAKGHTPTKGKWELSRFCNKNYVSVAGAAGKLFQHFIKNYTPTEVLSFADRRWSQGDLYRQLGFEFLGYTNINYWYIDLKNTQRIYRYQLRKNSDDDQSQTEYENRLQQGYLRIHDCGSSKWIWRPPEII